MGGAEPAYAWDVPRRRGGTFAGRLRETTARADASRAAILDHMARLRSIVSVVAVGLVAVAFRFVLGPAEPVEESAYDVTVERTVSIQAFLDAAPPGWTAVRTRVPPPGGGPVFLTSFPAPDPCREVGQSITCDGLPPIMLPSGTCQGP